MNYCMGDFGQVIDRDAIDRVMNTAPRNTPTQDDLRLFNLADGAVKSTTSTTSTTTSKEVPLYPGEVERDLDQDVADIESAFTIGSIAAYGAVLTALYFAVKKYI